MTQSELRNAIFAIDYTLLNKSLGDNHADISTLKIIDSMELQEARKKLVEQLDEEITLQPPL